jgi:predicted Zn-dependent protease
MREMGLDESIRVLRSLARAHPRDAEARKSLRAVALRRAREEPLRFRRERAPGPRAGRERIESYLLKVPTDAVVRCRLAELFLREGWAEGAIEEAKTAFGDDKSCLKAAELLVEACRAAGRLAEARAAEDWVAQLKARAGP